jgi:protein gp37
MNKTTIEWCDLTWNPVTGCKHGCPYCYARKIAERFRGSKAWPQGFEPMIHPERSNDPEMMKKPQTIFVCSMADLFGDWVPDHWISYVMESCDMAPRHTYIFLTKNPARYLKIPGEYLGRKNFWFGATVDGRPIPNGYFTIDTLKKLPEGNTFISFEPLLKDLGPLDLTSIKQVIIGAQTNPFSPVQLSWVEAIENAADLAAAKVFVKDSLKGLEGSPLFRRELAWGIHK